MQRKFRFVEGYVGNATVRGWKEYDSIYHAVFADFRGANGYPKGKAFDSVPQGLLLRPAIPNENPNGGEGFGPRANFKIAVRELPDDGRFRVSVLAAKYDDGLLLDTGAAPQLAGVKGAVTVNGADAATTIPRPGSTRSISIRAPKRRRPATPRGWPKAWWPTWNLEGPSWNLKGEARPVATPFGQGVKFGSEMDAIVIPYDDKLNVGKGDFTVSGWVRPAAAGWPALSAAAARTVVRAGWWNPTPPPACNFCPSAPMASAMAWWSAAMAR